MAEVPQAGWEQTFPNGGPRDAAPPDAKADATDAVDAAVERAADLSNYSKEELASSTKWVVGLKAGRKLRDLTSRVGSRKATPAPKLADTYVLEFAKDAPGEKVAARLKRHGGATRFFYPLIERQHEKRFVSNDPLFANQWHLKNTGQSGGVAGNDVNVQPAWDANYTGDDPATPGVDSVIAIVDDGLQTNHPDLAPNYLSAYSYDFNGGDSDPSPNPSNDWHGTAAAGVAAARGGNGVGVTGSAPHAGLAGIRLIAGGVTDATEANALTYQKANVDVYSNSWGPSDNGQTLAGPGPMLLAALADGVTNGRGGLGNVYTWAAGNGLQNNDNANYDGYANSRYTIAVAAVDDRGDQSYYSEPGAPILVTAHSNGNSSAITTTDLTGTSGYNGSISPTDYADENYTNTFGGTSSATPLVSGVVALMLDANPNLTWRDVKHILVNTARKTDAADTGWRVNGAGHEVSHKYGFGAVDAAAAVNAAETWSAVATEISATSGVVNVGTAIPDNNTTGVTSGAVIGAGIRAETVEVVLNATHVVRGDLRVVLTSPDGTESVLAEQHADTGDNYSNWVFTSNQHWDEVAAGTWTLRVTDASGNAVTGSFTDWKLNVYGTPADTSVHHVNLAHGQVLTGVDFGGRQTDPGGDGTIAGTVFHDYNDSAVINPGEPGIAGVTVYLDADNDGVLDAGEASTTSDAAGAYSFTGLANGTYNVRQVDPAGFMTSTTWQLVIDSSNQAWTRTDFDNTPVGDVAFTGTAAADTYLLRLNAAATRYEVLVGGTLKHVVPLDGVTSLSFNLGGGNDALTVDHVNGRPMPAGGLRYDGGGLQNVDQDALTVNGTDGVDTVGIVNVRVGSLPGNIALHTPGGGSSVEEVTFNGLGGDDVLTTDQALSTSVAFNAGSGADRVVYNSSNGSATIEYNTTTIFGSNDIVQFSSVEDLTLKANASDDRVFAIVNAGGPSTVTIDGGTESDDIYVTPSSTATFRVIGGDPAAAPGDRLNVNLGGADQSGMGPAAGDAGFQELRYANRLPVRYKEIETLGDGIDAAAPTADVTDVTPDPRTTAVDSVEIVFSEAVAGLDVGDLALTRDGGANLLGGAQTLTTANGGVTWTLGGLAVLTNPAGAYALTLAATGSGVEDLAGNPLAADAADAFTVLPGTVAARHVFYNRSAFDGNRAAADAGDDAAVAPDKSPYVAGTGLRATAANYTNYSRGLNGIIVDLAGGAGADLTAADFAFHTGNTDAATGWAAAAAPLSVTRRAGAGVDGADRYTLVWADNDLDGVAEANEAVAKAWLRVTVLANARTRLAAPDAFFFGNAPGETLNAAAGAASAPVDLADVGGTRNNQSGFTAVGLANRYDHNHDKRVDLVDVGIARNNQSGFSPLRMINVAGQVSSSSSTRTTMSAPLQREAIAAPLNVSRPSEAETTRRRLTDGLV